MSKETKKPTQEELLKACADVLDEALAEYDQLQKSMAVQEVPKQAEGIDHAEVIADPSKPAPAALPVPAIQANAAPGEAVNAPMAKDEEAEESEEEKAKKKKEAEEKEEKEGKGHEAKEESDEEMMEHFKSLSAKLEVKGLLKKSEIAAPIVEEKGEEFRKSVDERFEKLTASISEVSELVKKVASAPMQRRGVAGYAPLKKTEGSDAAPLQKGEVVNKLLDLRKNGERSIDTALINRVETSRLQKGDMERIKNLGILG
jgi:hypothetical protein